MPKPGKTEKQDEFIARFMGDKAMVKEYPDQKQRYAVCMSQWKQRMAANAREAFMQDPFMEQRPANHDGRNCRCARGTP
jgi:hypothetical protein